MTGLGPARTVLTLGGMIGLFAISSCANQGAPPGGPEDRTGPQIVETFPDTFAVIEAFDDPVRITFNERISERALQGTLDDAVLISPESGEVRVRHSSRELRVTMEGGFLPDEVYRITVEPLVQDLFRNPMVGTFEFIFSTGAEMTPTVLAGAIIDRITGEAVEGARVMARVEGLPGVAPGAEESDEVVIPTHVAYTDSSGVYAFRYVPAGRYVITAFVDDNRNREPDYVEPIGTSVEELSPADTVLLNFVLLAPDTTAALVQNVDVVDSLTLAVQFDDFLDPELELTGVSASLEPDSLNTAEVATAEVATIDVATILHERDYLARMDEFQDSVHVADSIRFEEELQEIESLLSVGDSVAAAEIESQMVLPRPLAPRGANVSQARELPTRALYFLLADTLATDQPYELSVAGVTNINGVADGGGTSEVLREASRRE